MLPLVAIPTVVLWIIAVILAFVNPGPVAGMSHHTYTGILFVLALVLTVVCFIVAQRAEKSSSNRVNSIALPLVLLLVQEPAASWYLVAALVLVLCLWAVILFLVADWKTPALWQEPEECTDNNVAQ